MNEDRLSQLLSVQPPDAEVAAAARRARHRALDRIGQIGPRRRQAGLRILSAGAAVAVLLGILVLRHYAVPEIPDTRPAATGATQHAQPLRVVFTLSDGTRVVWTVDHSLNQ
jgi:hypothetical protein